MNSPGQATGLRDLNIVFAAFAVVAYLEVVIFYWCHPLIIGHDQALHFECTKLILHGALPYVGFLDSNPPIIFYLDALPVTLSSWLSVPPPLVFSQWIVFLSLCSFIGSVFLVRKSIALPEFSSARAVLIALLLLSVFFRFDFGQREHIFVLFYSPFFLLRWLRWHGQKAGRLESILAGFFAAIGVCLKPFFLLPMLAVELFWLIDRRRMRPLLAPEMAGFVCGLLAYVIQFFFLPVSSQKAYFDFILPALKEGYRFFDISTIGQLGLEHKQIFVSGIFVCFVALLLRNRSSLILPLTVFSIASLPIYLLQNKGWTYHAMPFFAGAMYLACLLVWTILEEIEPLLKGYQLKVSAVVCAIVLLGWYFAGETIAYIAETKIPLEVLGWKGSCPIGDLSAPNLCKIVITHSSPGDRILFFSNGIWPEYPLTMQLNRQPGSRHLHACFLSILECIRMSDEHSKLLKYEDQIINEYATDINANKPKLIFVQINPVEEYLRNYDFEKKYLSEYSKIDDAEGFRVYTRRGG
jgi:hypothetical protein